jgi:oxalate decarboxylase/phosphoglucose isomerase-like protein (cupin superfamily)
VFAVLQEAYVVTLKPGDVLFVPRHWWHYVENVGVAVSINSWIPLVMIVCVYNKLCGTEFSLKRTLFLRWSRNVLLLWSLQIQHHVHKKKGCVS